MWLSTQNFIPKSNFGGDKTAEVNSAAWWIDVYLHSKAEGRVILLTTIALASPNYSSNAEVKLADPAKHPSFFLNTDSAHISATHGRTQRCNSSCRNRGRGLMFAEYTPTRLHASAPITFQNSIHINSSTIRAVKRSCILWSQNTCWHTSVFFPAMPTKL